MSNLKPSDLSQIVRIVYEEIPCKNTKYTFGKTVYGGFSVITMKENSYINATKLCADGGKKLKNWTVSDKPKKLVKEMTDELMKKDPSWDGKITVLVTGGENNLVRGTYVHPSLIPHIASWVSTKFACIISTILYKWRLLSCENELEYWTSMGESIEDSKNSNNNACTEMDIKMLLHKKYIGSRIEVKTPSGYIDILTDTEVIEIKKGNAWKDALGQLLAYGEYYPEHIKVVYLFEYKELNLDEIVRIFTKYGIVVRYHDL
jgi:hypothetical protein